jgi:hypothetical protein
MRQKAFQIQQMQIPEIDKPNPPVLSEIRNVWEINWKVSAGTS